MGDLIPVNIDDFVEDFLKNIIGVDVLDYQKVGSGGEGYTVIYVCNLDSDQSEVLRSTGFKQTEDDLWIFSGFEIEINKLKDTPVMKYLENLQKEKWSELIELRCEIDNNFYTKCNKTIFRSTHNTPRTVLKWYGKLTVDESTFNDFISDLYKILVEIDSESEKIAEICSSNFLKGIRCYRNTKIAHDSSKTDQLKFAEEYLNNLIGTGYPKHWYHFVGAQIRIIEDGIDFLNEIKLKEGEILDIFTSSQARN